MTRRVQTVSGNIGYRHQLNRARRFFDRVQTDYEGLEDIDEVGFQDMMWSFFQHCWHVKDWVRHDPLASAGQKQTVDDMVHKSAALLICRATCATARNICGLTIRARAPAQAINL